MKKWKRLYGLEDSFICPYCLKEVSTKYATRDHKNPISRFNDKSPENIVICCFWCNVEKGSLTEEEYKEWKRLEFIRHGGLSLNKGKQK